MTVPFYKLKLSFIIQFLIVINLLCINGLQCFSILSSSPLSLPQTSSFRAEAFSSSVSSGLRSKSWSSSTRIRQQGLPSFTRTTTSRLHSTDLSSNAQAGENSEESESVPIQDNDGERCLYDILNALPTDSTQTLKQNYRALARQTHPDSLIGYVNPDGCMGVSEWQREQAAVQFAEITAAYKTLSYPKTRLQYDRTLKAKEFTDNVVGSLEGGFRAAFETAYQTAGGIRAVGEKLDKAREETSYKLEMASKIAQYTTKSRAFNQRSLQEENRRAKLQQKLDCRGNRKPRHVWLERNNNGSSRSNKQNQELTANLANEIVKTLKQNYQSSSTSSTKSDASSNFGDPDTRTSSSGTKYGGMDETLTKTIDRMAQVEVDYQQVTQAYQQSQKDLTQAKSQVDRMTTKEEKALKALQEAQAAWETAKQATQDQKNAYGEVLGQERITYSKVEKVESIFTRQQDRTKDTLRRTEDLFVWKENSSLREEARKAKSLSEKLQDKSVQLQKKADELKQELDSI